MAQTDSSPARLFAGVVGATLFAAGIIGFFYEGSFTSDKSVRDSVFGLLDVNGWGNVVHLLSGLLGVLAYRAGNVASRTYALGLGVVYLVVVIWGFAVGDGDSILSIIPINTEDNILHVLITLAAFAAYGASSSKATTHPPSAAPA